MSRSQLRLELVPTVRSIAEGSGRSILAGTKGIVCRKVLVRDVKSSLCTPLRAQSFRHKARNNTQSSLMNAERDRNSYMS